MLAAAARTTNENMGSRGPPRRVLRRTTRRVLRRVLPRPESGVPRPETGASQTRLPRPGFPDQASQTRLPGPGYFTRDGTGRHRACTDVRQRIPLPPHGSYSCWPGPLQRATPIGHERIFRCISPDGIRLRWVMEQPDGSSSEPIPINLQQP